MRRVKIWAALLCALLLATCAPAPKTTGPALWRLTDADSEIYLLGTVHVLPPDLAWKTPAIARAFARADTVWFETPTDDASGRTIAEIVARDGVNPRGVTLSSQLAPEDRARLARVAASLGVPLAALEPYRPWMAALQLSLAKLTRQGHAASSGVEQALEKDAAAQKKGVAYFETVEEQIAIFTTLSPAAQRAFLTTTLRQIEDEKDETAEADRLWASGQADALARLIGGEIEEAGPETAEALIYARNARFAARIDALMKGHGRAFVAVGAAHMAGPRGVPALLRAKGYAVEGP